MTNRFTLPRKSPAAHAIRASGLRFDLPTRSTPRGEAAARVAPATLFYSDGTSVVDRSDPVGNTLWASGGGRAGPAPSRQAELVELIERLDLGRLMDRSGWMREQLVAILSAGDQRLMLNALETAVEQRNPERAVALDADIRGSLRHRIQASVAESHEAQYSSAEVYPLYNLWWTMHLNRSAVHDALFTLQNVAWEMSRQAMRGTNDVPLIESLRSYELGYLMSIEHVETSVFPVDCHPTFMRSAQWSAFYHSNFTLVTQWVPQERWPALYEMAMERRAYITAARLAAHMHIRRMPGAVARFDLARAMALVDAQRHWSYTTMLDRLNIFFELEEQMMDANPGDDATLSDDRALGAAVEQVRAAAAADDNQELATLLQSMTRIVPEVAANIGDLQTYQAAHAMWRQSLQMKASGPHIMHGDDIFQVLVEAVTQWFTMLLEHDHPLTLLVAHDRILTNPPPLGATRTVWPHDPLPTYPADLEAELERTIFTPLRERLFDDDGWLPEAMRNFRALAQEGPIDDIIRGLAPVLAIQERIARRLRDHEDPEMVQIGLRYVHDILQIWSMRDEPGI